MQSAITEHQRELAVRYNAVLREISDVAHSAEDMYQEAATRAATSRAASEVYHSPPPPAARRMSPRRRAASPGAARTATANLAAAIASCRRDLADVDRECQALLAAEAADMDAADAVGDDGIGSWSSTAAPVQSPHVSPERPAQSDLRACPRDVNDAEPAALFQHGSPSRAALERRLDEIEARGAAAFEYRQREMKERRAQWATEEDALVEALRAERIEQQRLRAATDQAYAMLHSIA